MREFIYSLMTDKRNGKFFIAFKFMLYLLSLLYALGLFARKACYGIGIFKTDKVPMKVISVGNITLGGTGKTPFVIMLSKILKEDLKRETSVLLRGYGWDEEALLSSRLPEIPVLAGEDRMRSAHRAIRLYGSDTAVLDDGFQHWELARDLDIVLIDSRNPFGNGRLFPRGILREPKAAIKRSDVIVFTKVNKRLFDIPVLKEDLKEIYGNGLVFLETMHCPKNIYDAKTKTVFELSHVKDKKLILLSSIGDPGYFEETAKDLGGMIISHIIFPDHHNYNKNDMDDVARRCDEKNFDMLLTTEKDAVKLNRMRLFVASYPVMVLAVEIKIVSGREDLIARLHSVYTG